MSTPTFDVVVVGGGIVGLATAHAVARTGRSVAVVEREPRLANHQTGNNSNVIHSGLYYAPGGLKARLAVAGCAETVGGLLAQRLGRVPLPGTEAEIAGLRMRAEGGKDERGRMRITTVLVEQIDRAESVEEETDVRAGS